MENKKNNLSKHHQSATQASKKAVQKEGSSKKQTQTRAAVEAELDALLERLPDIELNELQQEELAQDMIKLYSTVAMLSTNVERVEKFLCAFNQNYPAHKESIRRYSTMKNKTLLNTQQAAMHKDILRCLPFLSLLTVSLEKCYQEVCSIWKTHGSRQEAKLALEQRGKNQDPDSYNGGPLN
ncbi:MAG: hypothetical protein ACTHMC_17675 [Pseudobacter sp.]|uniref:hypothetical protein n=1 Tax=Pseudobacter sp. TaxID=2045420 RepID=UPI003F81D516